MANETAITIVGNLVDDPEFRFTNSGQAVVRFRIAANERYVDRQTGEWKDGGSLFLTCNAWRELGEHVAESLQRGMRVIVQGRLRQRSYETDTGDKRTVYEIEVDEIGPALRFAIAKVTKVKRGQQTAQIPQQDPWPPVTPIPTATTTTATVGAPGF
ncbi:single-stranded DNA-binding protein (plasmid) [Sphaerimonospora sp. CA-214678]|uniref:single-stranded DNA-binding protein n=1 Tax=Sphaerimonospora sp. CA-214678 TaxID=3240029 RepID=UPI003D9094E8